MTTPFVAAASKTAPLESGDEELCVPDGQKVIVGDERHQCTEILFQPSLIGLPLVGVHELLLDSIMKNDVHTRHSLFGQIILAGGNCMHRGFAERLREEMVAMAMQRSLAHLDASLRVIAPPERRSSTWIGGSVLGSLWIFPEMLVTRPQYDEEGPAVVNRRRNITH